MRSRIEQLLLLSSDAKALVLRRKKIVLVNLILHNENVIMIIIDNEDENKWLLRLNRSQSSVHRYMYIVITTQYVRIVYNFRACYSWWFSSRIRFLIEYNFLQHIDDAEHAPHVNLNLELTHYTHSHSHLPSETPKQLPKRHTYMVESRMILLNIFASLKIYSISLDGGKHRAK